MYTKTKNNFTFFLLLSTVYLIFKKKFLGHITRDTSMVYLCSLYKNDRKTKPLRMLFTRHLHTHVLVRVTFCVSWARYSFIKLSTCIYFSGVFTGANHGDESVQMAFLHMYMNTYWTFKKLNHNFRSFGFWVVNRRVFR